MKSISTTFLAFLLFACNKQEKPFAIEKQPLQQKQNVSSGENDGLSNEVIQTMIYKYNPQETLLGIDSVNVISDNEKRYTLVYYRSNLRKSNILIEEQLEADKTQPTSVKCEGNCDCLVKVNLGTDGSVHASCTCSDCSLVIQ